MFDEYSFPEHLLYSIEDPTSCDGCTAANTHLQTVAGKKAKQRHTVRVTFEQRPKHVEDTHASDADSAPVHPSTPVTKSKEDILWERIDSAFEEALTCVGQWPNKDITIVTDYLMFSTQALEKSHLATAGAYYRA